MGPLTPGSPLADHPHVEHRHVMDYVRILYRRRWLAGPLFVAVALLASLNALRQTPIYQARAQLLIEGDAPKVAQIDQVFQPDGAFNDDFRETQYRLLQSRSLARRTIDQLQLWDAPRLGNGPPPTRGLLPMLRDLGARALDDARTLVERVAFGRTEIVRQAARSSAAASGVGAAAVESASVTDGAKTAAAAKTAETASQTARIDEFLDGLAIAPVRNSRLVEVMYRSSDPAFAARAANGLARAFIDQDVEQRSSSTRDVADWLSARLEEQRRALDASESALQAFKEKNGTLSLTDSASNLIVQRLTDLNTALTRARTQRIDKESQYKQLLSAAKSGSIDAHPSAIASDSIQAVEAELTALQRQRAQLAQRYGERHAEMIKVTTAIEDAERKLQSELTKLVEVARISYQAAVAEEDSLRATLDSQKQEALGANRKSIEYSVLQREVDSNQQIFDTLLQHTKETGLTAALRSKNVRIVDEAEVPTVAVEPRLRRELALGLAAALLLAVACTFLVDYLDDRIDSPAEIRQRLGVPFLGLIPAVSEDAEESALLNRQQDPLFAEVFKTIRTNILFSIAAEGPRTIVVTSASPHEGKTVVASNLAVALAQSGQRVLLVDADMRRPRLHEVVGIPQEPGLSNVLTANAQPSAAIRAGQVENLWVLPAGVIPPNPAELLGSQRYRVLLGSIDSFFDWIVVDSPPVLAVADASLLANEATGVIFVVATAQTARSNATAALEQLAHARARVLGAVLNKAQVGKHPYYYARYYRKQYSVYHMPAGVEGAA